MAQNKMTLSPQLIGKLKGILKEEWNTDVSMEEVAEIGHNWVNYFGMLLKIEERWQREQAQKASQ